MRDEDDPLEEILARSRDRAQRLQAWLEHLRAAAIACLTWPRTSIRDFSEWPASVYLLSGCEEVWGELGGEVMAERSIAPVLRELGEPRRAWSSSEDAVMAWAAHFWDVGQRRRGFSYVFEQFHFQRWMIACHLRQKMPPALTVTGGPGS